MQPFSMPVGSCGGEITTGDGANFPFPVDKYLSVPTQGVASSVTQTENVIILDRWPASHADPLLTFNGCPKEEKTLKNVSLTIGQNLKKAENVWLNRTGTSDSDTAGSGVTLYPKDHDIADNNNDKVYVDIQTQDNRLNNKNDKGTCNSKKTEIIHSFVVKNVRPTSEFYKSGETNLKTVYGGDEHEEREEEKILKDKEETEKAIFTNQRELLSRHQVSQAKPLVASLLANLKAGEVIPDRLPEAAKLKITSDCHGTPWLYQIQVLLKNLMNLLMSAPDEKEDFEAIKERVKGTVGQEIETTDAIFSFDPTEKRITVERQERESPEQKTKPGADNPEQNETQDMRNTVPEETPNTGNAELVEKQEVENLELMEKQEVENLELMEEKYTENAELMEKQDAENPELIEGKEDVENPELIKGKEDVENPELIKEKDIIESRELLEKHDIEDAELTEKQDAENPEFIEGKEDVENPELIKGKVDGENPELIKEKDSIEPCELLEKQDIEDAELTEKQDAEKPELIEKQEVDYPKMMKKEGVERCRKQDKESSEIIKKQDRKKTRRGGESMKKRRKVREQVDKQKESVAGSNGRVPAESRTDDRFPMDGHAGHAGLGLDTGSFQPRYDGCSTTTPDRSVRKAIPKEKGTKSKLRQRMQKKGLIKTDDRINGFGDLLPERERVSPKYATEVRCCSNSTGGAADSQHGNGSHGNSPSGDGYHNNRKGSNGNKSGGDRGGTEKKGGGAERENPQGPGDGSVREQENLLLNPDDLSASTPAQVVPGSTTPPPSYKRFRKKPERPDDDRGHGSHPLGDILTAIGALTPSNTSMFGPLAAELEETLYHIDSCLVQCLRRLNHGADNSDPTRCTICGIVSPLLGHFGRCPSAMADACFLCSQLLNLVRLHLDGCCLTNAVFDNCEHSLAICRRIHRQAPVSAQGLEDREQYLWSKLKEVLGRLYNEVELPASQTAAPQKALPVKRLSLKRKVSSKLTLDKIPEHHGLGEPSQSAKAGNGPSSIGPTVHHTLDPPQTSMERSNTSILIQTMPEEPVARPITKGRLLMEKQLVYINAGHQSLPDRRGSWATHVQMYSLEDQAKGVPGIGEVVYGDVRQLSVCAKHWTELKARHARNERISRVSREEGVILVQYRDKLQVGKTRYQEGVQWGRVTSLGKGMSGRCYLTRDYNTDAQFCAKEIPLSSYSEDELLIWGKLEHNHIVKLHGAIRCEHNVFILAEFIDGGCLTEHINKHLVLERRLSKSVALRYFQQLLNVLVYLQQENVLHEDLKADNILLRKERAEIVVADFGLARQVQPGERVGKTQPIGSQPQWSPEKAASQGYDFRSDVWAATCVLAHIFNGEPPWVRQYSHFKMLHYIIPNNSPPLEDMPRNVTEDILQIMRSGWNPIMENRPFARDMLRMINLDLHNSGDKLLSNIHSGMELLPGGADKSMLVDQSMSHDLSSPRGASHDPDLSTQQTAEAPACSETVINTPEHLPVSESEQSSSLPPDEVSRSRSRSRSPKDHKSPDLSLSGEKMKCLVSSHKGTPENNPNQLYHGQCLSDPNSHLEHYLQDVGAVATEMSNIPNLPLFEETVSPSDERDEVLSGTTSSVNSSPSSSVKARSFSLPANVFPHMESPVEEAQRINSGDLFGYGPSMDDLTDARSAQAPGVAAPPQSLPGHLTEPTTIGTKTAHKTNNPLHLFVPGPGSSPHRHNPAGNRPVSATVDRAEHYGGCRPKKFVPYSASPTLEHASRPSPTSKHGKKHSPTLKHVGRQSPTVNAPQMVLTSRSSPVQGEVDSGSFNSNSSVLSESSRVSSRKGSQPTTPLSSQSTYDTQERELLNLTQEIAEEGFYEQSEPFKWPTSQAREDEEEGELLGRDVDVLAGLEGYVYMKQHLTQDASPGCLIRFQCSSGEFLTQVRITDCYKEWLEVIVDIAAPKIHAVSSYNRFRVLDKDGSVVDMGKSVGGSDTCVTVVPVTDDDKDTSWYIEDHKFTWN